MPYFRSCFVLLCVVISIQSAFSQEKYNLNFNDFDPNEERLPKGWFVWGDFKTVVGDRENPNNAVGKIVSDKKGKFGCIAYQIPANYIGDTIVLSGKIKYEKVKNYVGLLIRIDGKKSVAFRSMQYLQMRGSRDWKEYSIKLPYPTNAANIYVGGILGKGGTAWCDDFKVTIDGKDIQTLEETPVQTLAQVDSKQLQQAIKQASSPLDWSRDAQLSKDLDALIEKVGDKRIVALGESTHGTSEFYKLRALLTKRLVEEKGFNQVVLENPYDNIERLNMELDTKPLDSLIKRDLFSIYQTEEVKSFIEWYKSKRATVDVEFKGCDDSYWSFLEVLTDRLKDTPDNQLELQVQQLKTHVSKSTKANRKKELRFNNLIYEDIVQIEKYLKDANMLDEDLEELLFNGKNSYINYVHVKNGMPIQSRDKIMADRIAYLARDTNNKIIVWAHNAHIANEVIADNEIGVMGRDLKAAFGEDYYTIGQMTSEGTYSYMEEKLINADEDYSEMLETAVLQQQDELLWEDLFAECSEAFILDQKELKKSFDKRIMGLTKLVGYAKETEKDQYFLPLMEYYDSLIYINKTQATSPVF